MQEHFEVVIFLKETTTGEQSSSLPPRKYVANTGPFDDLSPRSQRGMRVRSSYPNGQLDDPSASGRLDEEEALEPEEPFQSYPRRQEGEQEDLVLPVEGLDVMDKWEEIG